jgi:hypothetical protein
LVQKKISKIEAFVNFILEIINPKYLPKGIEYAATPEIENNGMHSSPFLRKSKFCCIKQKVLCS